MWQKYSRVRLIYKRSSTLTKVLVLVAVVFSTVTLLGLRSLTLKAEARNAEVLNQIGTQEQEKAKLKEKTEAAGTLEGIKDIAREELGLEDPDTIILVPES